MDEPPGLERWFYERLMAIERKNKMATLKKIKNKFYVGSPKMNPLSSDGSVYRIWAKETLAEAVDHAKQKCEETGEPQIVVQIIKIVRPQKTPVIVENA